MSVPGLLPADATDAQGHPVLLAVDHDEVIPFSVDPEQCTVTAEHHDVTLLNMLARWLKLLPPQAPCPPPPHIIQQQLSDAVKRAKDQGNASYRQKDYHTAIKHYTMGLAMASGRPMWEASGIVAEELGILLANRSAAFLAAEAYIEALCDADAVIQIKSAWGKGYYRKGQALQALKRFEEARAAYDLGFQFEPENTDFSKAIAELPA